jgi:hypothetical protein
MAMATKLITLYGLNTSWTLPKPSVVAFLERKPASSVEDDLSRIAARRGHDLRGGQR